MSPHEADTATSGALEFSPPNRRGVTIATGTIELFDVDFSLSATFRWNTGMRTLAILHRGDEDDQTCRALATASAAEVTRGLGLVTPEVPRDRTPWFARANTDDDGSEQSIWWVNWYAGGSAGNCTVGVRVQAPPPLVPDALHTELIGVDWVQGAPTWLSTATREEMLLVYPSRARIERAEGDVDLACRVRLEGGGLRCALLEELPAGYGFGDVALDLAETRYRIEPMVGGEPTAGRQIRLRIEFRDPPD